MEEPITTDVSPEPLQEEPPVEPLQEPPEEPDIKVDDKSYRDNTTPDSEEGFEHKKIVLEAEGFDVDLSNSFKAHSYKVKFTQGQFSGAVTLWNNCIADRLLPDEIREKFSKLGKSEKWTPFQFQETEKWFGEFVKQTKREIAKIQKNSLRVTGRKKSDADAAELAALYKHPAYMSKYDKSHKAVMKRIHQLTGARK